MINVRFYMFNKCYKIKKFLFQNFFKILIKGLQQYRNNNIWYLSVRLKVHVYENIQGFNARKVISEVYASFVVQCTVSGR